MTMLEAERILHVPFEKIKEMMELDVTHLSESRLGLTYLPWAEAELLLREHFPTYKVDATIKEYHRGDTTYVMVESFIIDISTGKCTLPEHFPVMDNTSRRLSIPNPGTREISDAIKRAGVKVIARETGIGLNLYRKEKEDLPQEKLERPTEVQSNTTEPQRRSFARKLV